MGGRSRAAAQVLAGKGFREVYNLKGGIRAWDGLTAKGPSEMGMSFLTGEETAKEIVIIAYGMEEGLGAFYRKMAEMADHAEAISLFEQLAGFEDHHKDRLSDLYDALVSGTEKGEGLDHQVVDMMEGGFTPREFLEQNQDAIGDLPAILNMAMMLEAQAMDLYHRYAQKVTEEKAQTLLYDIAEEEKMHLNRLGELLQNNLL
ncbi:MAG: sulfurtransferase [Deltaproteobacteria bacterium]|nr:sulfurtransferase [Deltaproteobacteria bacterium]